jgi:hypothetical protein
MKFAAKSNSLAVVGRSLRLLLAVALINGAVAHIALSTVGTGEPAVEALSSPDFHATPPNCAGHKYDVQCAMHCPYAMVDVTPAMPAAASTLGVEIIPVFAAPQAEIVPSARGPPLA